MKVRVNNQHTGVGRYFNEINQVPLGIFPLVNRNCYVAVFFPNTAKFIKTY
jgi:hypothetical protein